MGYAFNQQIPAAGGTPVPISVSGQTVLTCPTGDIQVAYDIADFNSNQFTLVSGAASPQVLNFSLSGKTILWIRQDPDAGAPATTLYVWTSIDEVN